MNDHPLQKRRSYLNTREGGAHIDTHACMGACEQGRRECSTPEQCRFERAMTVVWWCGMAAILAVFLVLAVGGWLPGGSAR